LFRPGLYFLALHPGLVRFHRPDRGKGPRQSGFQVEAGTVENAGDLLAHQLARRERKLFVSALVVQGEHPVSDVSDDDLLAVHLHLQHGVDRNLFQTRSSALDLRFDRPADS
jgi:hypothetical protein